jgi:hypothetical protein
LQSIWPFVLAGLGWIAAWIGTHFVGQPLLTFRDLRGDVIYKLTLFGNVRARAKEPREDIWSVPDEIKISDEDNERLKQAEHVFRDLASQMRKFATNEPLAVWIVRWRGYDPVKASAGLIGVSNSIGTEGQNKVWQKKTVMEALRIESI